MVEIRIILRDSNDLLSLGVTRKLIIDRAHFVQKEQHPCAAFCECNYKMVQIWDLLICISRCQIHPGTIIIPNFGTDILFYCYEWFIYPDNVMLLKSTMIINSLGIVAEMCHSKNIKIQIRIGYPHKWRDVV